MDEYEHGQRLLEAKLERHRPGLVILTYKRAARKLFGSFVGNGFIDGLKLAHSDVFVMPGPYQPAAAARPALDDLAAHFERTRRSQLYPELNPPTGVGETAVDHLARPAHHPRSVDRAPPIDRAEQMRRAEAARVNPLASPPPPRRIAASTCPESMRCRRRRMGHRRDLHLVTTSGTVHEQASTTRTRSVSRILRVGVRIEARRQSFSAAKTGPLLADGAAVRRGKEPPEVRVTVNVHLRHRQGCKQEHLTPNQGSTWTAPARPHGVFDAAGETVDRLGVVANRVELAALAQPATYGTLEPDTSRPTEPQTMKVTVSTSTSARSRPYPCSRRRARVRSRARAPAPARSRRADC